MRVDRLNEMEKYIVERRTASLQNLAAEFQVSMNTIRRDIDLLLQRGSIYKVYGGVAAHSARTLLPMDERIVKNAEGKDIIGKLGASLVQDHSVIFVDTGSTTICLIQYLAERIGVTIVTHSLSVMKEAAKYPNLQIIAVGGCYNPITNSYFGGINNLMDIRVHAAFLGATGITFDGAGSSVYEEYQTKKFVAAHAEQRIVMADYTKMGLPLSFRYCGLPDVNTIVTDREPPKEYRELFRKEHILVLHPNSHEAAQGRKGTPAKGTTDVADSVADNT